MAIDYKMLGERIRKYRVKQGLTQARLAEMVGTSPSNISHIERGKTKPSLQIVTDIANQLQTPMDKLMYGNIKESKTVFAEELEEILADCDLEEREIVLRCAEAIKSGLRKKGRSKDIK